MLSTDLIRLELEFSRNINIWRFQNARGGWGGRKRSGKEQIKYVNGWWSSKCATLPFCVGFRLVNIHSGIKSILLIQLPNERILKTWPRFTDYLYTYRGLVKVLPSHLHIYLVKKSWSWLEGLGTYLIQPATRLKLKHDCIRIFYFVNPGKKYSKERKNEWMNWLAVWW